LKTIEELDVRRAVATIKMRRSRTSVWLSRTIEQLTGFEDFIAIENQDADVEGDGGRV